MHSYFCINFIYMPVAAAALKDIKNAYLYFDYEKKVLDIFFLDYIWEWDSEVIDIIKQAANEGYKIKTYIDSEGGYLKPAMGINAAIRQFVKPEDSEAYILGTGASAATIIAMAHGKIFIDKYASFLVHNVSGAEGEVAEHFNAKIAQMISDKSGMTVDAARALMNEDRLLTAAEAIELKLVDDYMGESPTAQLILKLKNSLEMDFSKKFDELKNLITGKKSDEAPEVEAPETPETPTDELESLKNELAETKAKLEEVTNSLNGAVDAIEKQALVNQAMFDLLNELKETAKASAVSNVGATTVKTVTKAPTVTTEKEVQNNGSVDKDIDQLRKDFGIK